MAPSIRTILLMGFIALPSSAGAQPAELEVRGVFGECIPVWAAAQEGLTLYASPDLRSEQKTIPYGEGWYIPAPKQEGLTRVIKTGTLRVMEPDERMYCRVRPESGPDALVSGELVELLYPVGEGFGEIRFRGAQCQAAVNLQLGKFETIKAPEVQVWLRVFYGDGTTAGWLLHDGTQTRVADVRC